MHLQVTSSGWTAPAAVAEADAKQDARQTKQGKAKSAKQTD